MVLVLPTVGSQLGPGLDQLIAGINHAVNPDYGFQQAMKAQLATNPKLVTALADLEVQAPGTLDKLGFGPLTRLLKAVPESPEGQFRRTSSGDIVQGEQAKLAADTGAAKLQANLHGKVLAAIGNSEDPNAQALIHNYIDRFLSGANTAELAATQARARQEQATAAEKEAELPLVLANVQKKQTELNDYLKNYPELAKADPVELINDVLAGRKTTVDLAQYAMKEGGPEALNTARIIADMKFRAAEARANRALSQKLDPTERANIQTAATLARQTRIGDVSTWRTVLEDPGAVKELRAKDPKTLTPEEKDIIKADDAAAQKQAMDQQRQDMNDQLMQMRTANELRQSYFTAQNTIKNASTPEAFAAGLAQMNQVVGPLGYQAKFGTPPKVGQVDTQNRQRGGFFSNDWFTPGNQLFFVDANNKRVEPEQIFVNKQFQQKAQMNQAATNFVMQYNSDKDPARKKANLDKLKAEQPETYNLIKDKIKE